MLAEPLFDLALSWHILFDLVKFLLGLVFCVLDFCEFSSLGSKNRARSNTNHLKCFPTSNTECSGEVLETGRDETLELDKIYNISLARFVPRAGAAD